MIRIKQIRNEKNITAKTLATHVGVAESTMSLYENGKREPDYKTLQKIAEYLDVSIDYLLGTSDVPRLTEYHPDGYRLPSNVQILQMRQFPKLSKIPGVPKQADPSSWQLTPEEQVRIVGNLRGDLSVSEFAQKCGVAETVLKELESGFDFDANGRAEEKNEALANVAKATGFPLPQLTHRVTLTQAGLLQSFPVYESPTSSKRVACAPVPFADEAQYDSYVEAPANLQADFCLTALDDSMSGARIQKGDIVFIRAQSTVESGKIAAVIVNNEAILRHWFYYPEKNKLVLTPENPAYEPLVFIGDEVNSVRCLGLSVSFMSNL